MPGAEQVRQRVTRQIARNPAVWVGLAIFANLLWGSAFPAVKQGYELWQVDTGNPFAIMVFAGLRFTLAGLLTLLLGKLLLGSFPVARRRDWSRLLMLGVIQTTLQYTFFYIGLANTSGVKSAILNATSGFIGVILAHFFYRDDRINARKGLALVLGLTGIVVLNLSGGGEIEWSFSFLGEGFVLLCAATSAFGSLISKRYAATISPFAVTGYQLLTGGVLLMAIGSLGGGRVSAPSVQALGLLLYLALLSAAAFTIWTTLLKYHSLSRISIFKSLVPVFGSLLSWLLLGEDFWSLPNLLALAAITGGILLLNRRRPGAAGTSDEVSEEDLQTEQAKVAEDQLKGPSSP